MALEEIIDVPPWDGDKKRQRSLWFSQKLSWFNSGNFILSQI